MSREKFNQKERLKKIRLKMGGISQANLSKQLGIPVHKIKDIESGKIKLSVDLALLLEEYFNFSFRWLLTGEGEMLCKKDTNKVCPENSMDKDTERAHKNLVVYKQQEHRQLEGIKEAGVEYGGCENLKISDLVAKTIEILECESIYKAALASNINAFYYSIQTQNTLETMNKKVATMEKQMAELMNSLNRQEWVEKEAEKNIA